MQEEKEELILEQAEADSPKREKVSYTKLSTFLQCPYKFQKIYEALIYVAVQNGRYLNLIFHQKRSV